MPLLIAGLLPGAVLHGGTAGSLQRGRPALLVPARVEWLTPDPIPTPPYDGAQSNVSGMPMLVAPGMRRLLREVQPIPPYVITIRGYTYDSAGVALPFCAVYLHRTFDAGFVAQTQSDATGFYIFTGIILSAETQHYAVAFLPGQTSTVAGVTLNTIIGN